ncbi:S8 family serine peptidase, partial [Candidatus Nanopelagicales bacterium]|nr:S8 family serine peptidase [Candidatus Nanopelagicales bacterium]
DEVECVEEVLGESPTTFDGPLVSYIVQLSSAANIASTQSVVETLGGTVTHTYTNVFPGMAVQLSDEAAAELRKNPSVVEIEADGVVTVSNQANPTWGIDRVDQRDLPLDNSYDPYGTGSGVVVYIVDTGIRASHNEYSSRVAAGTDTVDNDSIPEDCHGHGTHVAGTAVGTQYGVAKGATVVGVRVLDCSGSGSYSGVIGGLEWIAANHGTNHPGKPAVANMSLGGPASATMDAAVQSLSNSGVTVVVAAGNSSAPASGYSPARATSAVTVGSTTSTDGRSYFSNYGSTLDIFAPGSNILSASASCDSCSTTMSGTSMASPHAAGAAAVYLGANASANPSQVSAALAGQATAGLVTDPKSGSPNLLLFMGDPTGASRPQITGITPNTGPYSGGQSVTINGTNFTDATSVEIGGTAATGVTVVSDSQITATTPTLGASSFDSVSETGPSPKESDPIALAEAKLKEHGAASVGPDSGNLPKIQSAAIVDAAGCSANSLGRTDDWGSNRNPSLGFNANWFGTSYNKIQINNNGGVAFDNNNGSFSDYRGVVLGTTTRPVILPLFTDVDTRNTSTSPTTHGAITWDGSPAYCVNWINVGEHPSSGPKFSFQLLIVDRSSVIGRQIGDVDVVFNYATVGTPTYAGNGKFVIGYADPNTRTNSRIIATASDDPGNWKDGGAQALISSSTGVSPAVPGRYLYSISSDEADRAVDVSVTTPAGTGSMADGYIYSQERPIVTSLSRTSGPTSGAVSVLINGRNFSTVSGTSAVTFGGTRVVGLTVHSD